QAFMGECYNIGLCGNNPPPDTGAITATVKDSVTGSGIPQATLTVDTKPPNSSVTFDDGSMKYAYVPPGSYTLSAAKAGYISNSASVTVKVNDIVQPQIPLTPI